MQIAACRRRPSTRARRPIVLALHVSEEEQEQRQQVGMFTAWHAAPFSPYMLPFSPVSEGEAEGRRHHSAALIRQLPPSSTRLGRGAAPTNKSAHPSSSALSDAAPAHVSRFPSARPSQHHSSTWDNALLRRALLRACSAPALARTLVPACAPARAWFGARASPQRRMCAASSHREDH